MEWKLRKFPTVQHIFSHRKWQIELLEGIVTDKGEFSHRKWQIELLEGIVTDKGESLVTDKEMVWVSPEDFHQYPFAKPQQKMWESFQSALT